MASRGDEVILKICGACLVTGKDVNFVSMGCDFWSFAEFCGKINYYFSSAVWLCEECSERVKGFLQFRDRVRKATNVIYEIVQDLKLGKPIDYKHLKRSREYIYGTPQLVPAVVVEKPAFTKKSYTTYKYPAAEKEATPIGLTRKYLLPSSAQRLVNSIFQKEVVNDNIVRFSVDDAGNSQLNKQQIPETSDPNDNALAGLPNSNAYQIILDPGRNRSPVNEHDYEDGMETVEYLVEDEFGQDSELDNERSGRGHQEEELWEILPEVEVKSGDENPLKPEVDGEIVPLEGAENLMQLIVEKEVKNPKIKAKQKSLHIQSAKTKSQDPDPYVEFDMVYLTRSQIMADLDERRLDKRYVQANFKCEPCARGFLHQKEFDEHKEKHDPSYGDDNCDICGQYCKTRRCYYKHYHRHCVRYKCTRCDFIRSHNGNSVMQHYRKMHKCPEETHCTFCNRVFLNADYPTHNCDKKSITCEYCNERMSRNVYNGHVLLKHMERPFKCPHCVSSFPRQKLLDFHVKICHTGVHYCEDCKRSFKTKYTLDWHLNHSRQHMTPGKPINLRKCEHCSLEMPFNSYLKHVHRFHPTYAEFRCRQCPEVRQTRFELNKHVRMHSRERNRMNMTIHCCDVCGKSFRSREHFTRHKKIHLHTDERPFKCAVCDRTFITRETCFLHIQRVHEGRVRIKKRAMRFRKAKAAPGGAAARVKIEDRSKTEESICVMNGSDGELSVHEAQEEIDPMEI